MKWASEETKYGVQNAQHSAIQKTTVDRMIDDKKYGSYNQNVFVTSSKSVIYMHQKNSHPTWRMRKLDGAQYARLNLIL